MRYRLSTLMVAMVLVPPLAAWVWWLVCDYSALAPVAGLWLMVFVAAMIWEEFQVRKFIGMRVSEWLVLAAIAIGIMALIARPMSQL